MEQDDAEIQKKLKELFTHAYKVNAEIEEEELTEEDHETLEDLDSLEVIANFLDLVNDLLNNKRELKTSKEQDLLIRNEKFETMIQKLEGDVRNHIKIEQQLNLHCEALEERLNTIEKHDNFSLPFDRDSQDSESIKKLAEDFDAQRNVINSHSAMLSLNRDLEEQLREAREELEICRKSLQNYWNLESKHKKASELAEKRHKIMRKLEKQSIKYKALYEEKQKEIEVVKAENARLNADLVLNKSKKQNVVESNIKIGINLKKNQDKIRRQKSFEMRKSNSGIEDTFKRGKNESQGMRSFRENDFSTMRTIMSRKSASRSKLEVYKTPTPLPMRVTRSKSTIRKV